MASWIADERYTQLVDQRGRELLRLATMLTGNRHDAEDAVQDAVLAVSSSWPRVTPAGAFAYLRKAVVRQAIDPRRRREIAVEQLPEAVVEENGFLRLEQDRQFFARVQQLPDRQRAVVVLRYYADLDDRQIAALLACSHATVRSNAFRALEQLRRSTVKETR